MRKGRVNWVQWLATVVLLVAACNEPEKKLPIEGEFLVGRWQIFDVIDSSGRRFELGYSFLANRIVEYHRNGTVKNWSDEFNHVHDHWKFESEDSILVVVPANDQEAESRAKIYLLPDGTLKKLAYDPEIKKRFVIRLKRVGPVLGKYLGWGAHSRLLSGPSKMVMMDGMEPVPKDFTGTAIRFSEAGNRDTSMVSTFVDGVGEGPFRIYWENGRLETLGSMKDKKMDGRYEEYFPNGQLFFAYAYRKNRLWNVLAMNDSLGEPLDYGTLRDGNGIVKRYSIHTGFEAEGSVRNGLKEGFWKQWSGREFTDSTEYRNGINQRTGLLEIF